MSPHIERCRGFFISPLSLATPEWRAERNSGNGSEGNTGLTKREAGMEEMEGKAKAGKAGNRRAQRAPGCLSFGLYFVCLEI